MTYVRKERLRQSVPRQDADELLDALELRHFDVADASAEKLPDRKVYLRRHFQSSGGPRQCPGTTFNHVVARGLRRDGQPATCEKSADPDDSGALTVSDAMVLVQWFFAEGPPAPDPLECGPDLTGDDLGCGTFGPCDG